MKPEVLVVSPIPPELRERLSINYSLVERSPAPGERLENVPVVVTTSMGGASREMMDALPDLKLIACNGAGLDRIDVDAAKARDIIVQNTPDSVTADTADCAIGLIYSVVRRIAEADRFVRSGQWVTKRMTPSRRVFSLKIGIVGLGKIGSTIAGRAAAIGMTVSYTGPNRKGDTYDYVADLGELAAKVDVLVLSCPAGPSTEGLVDSRILAALGPQGYLINVSRGSVVVENDLVEALRNKSIAGAGLDVFENEPNIDPRFFDLENVVLQPHLAAVTTETRLDMADVLEAAIDRHFARR